MGAEQVRRRGGGHEKGRQQRKYFAGRERKKMCFLRRKRSPKKELSLFACTPSDPLPPPSPPPPHPRHLVQSLCVCVSSTRFCRNVATVSRHREGLANQSWPFGRDGASRTHVTEVAPALLATKSARNKSVSGFAAGEVIQ